METPAAILSPAKMLVKKSVKIDKCRYTKTESLLFSLLFIEFITHFLFFSAERAADVVSVLRSGLNPKGRSGRQIKEESVLLVNANQY